MIWIDYKDSRPIYEQIVEKYEKLILSGTIETDTKLPSIRSLAMELSLNPNTVQKAYSELDRRGYIYKVAGKGVFVNTVEEELLYKQKNILKKISKLVQEAKELGIEEKDIKKCLAGDK